MPGEGEYCLSLSEEVVTTADSEKYSWKKIKFQKKKKPQVFSGIFCFRLWQNTDICKSNCPDLKSSSNNLQWEDKGHRWMKEVWNVFVEAQFCTAVSRDVEVKEKS